MMVSAAAGYRLAEWRLERAIGEQELVSLDRLLAVRAYVDKQDNERAKEMLDINMDRHLTGVRKYFRAADEKQRAYELRVVGGVRDLWTARPPFQGADFVALKTQTDWVEMRRENDQFLKSNGPGSN
jgi:hypothetical protein